MSTYDANEDHSDGYKKALNDIESLPKMKGWVAREKDGTLSFFSNKPKRFLENNDFCDGWFCEEGCETAINFNCDIPELKWESEPIEVELLIRKI